MKDIKIRKRIFISAMCFSLVASSTFLRAQSPAAEKLTPGIQLVAGKKADNSISVSLFVTAVVKGQKKRNPASDTKVNIYTISNGTQKLIQTVKTGINGKSEFTLQESLPLDTGNNYYVIAKIENNPLYDDAEESVHYKAATLTLNLKQQDTIRTAIGKLTVKDKDGKDVPVKGAEVGFFAKRLFGAMAVAEDNKNTTDDNGEAVFIFPKVINIPGDDKGNMDLIARISDNDIYGNIETKAGSNWGAIVPLEKNPFPRDLWASSAPPALVITICVLFGGIWSIFTYMFIQMGKIKSEKTTEKRLTNI